MNEHAIADNITKLVERVRLSSQKRERCESDIRILAVSKTRDSGAIRQAVHCGLTEFGENYLQEALDKIRQLEDLDLTWHFIGPIQSNKTRSIAEHFDWVHSVDRSRVARRLSEQRPSHLQPLQACIQVNISGESSKSGIAVAALPELANQMLALPGITLRGLMAIPATTSDTAQQASSFAAVRRAFEDLQKVAPNMDTLSMGMSSDMEAAIAEGSTIVRIGTDIFGPRIT
jgi:pyridoxal phosphate enzyme (YggS family)